METQFGMSECEGEGFEQQQFCSVKSYNFMSKEKEVIEDEDHEWDANDWEWNSSLFTAKNLNIEKEKDFEMAVLSISSCLPETHNQNINSTTMDKRRKILTREEEEMAQEAACLTLKLGASEYSIANGEGEGEPDGGSGSKGGKRPRGAPTSSHHHHPICQVDDCKADLNNAKDYHRRHKVCEMHAKATQALVGHHMQRFCQQCSRFHLLQEFDEGKRSCRRRLAGHNRRRRKTHPDAIVAGACLNDEHASVSLIISLLRVLSQIQTSNNSEHTSNQDLIVQLLKKLASSLDETNREPATHTTANWQDNILTCNGTSEIGKPRDSVRPQDAQCSMINGLTVASSSRLGGVGPHPDAFQSSKVSSICGQEQTFCSTDMPQNVFNVQGSAQTTSKIVPPVYSHNSRERQQGFHQQLKFTASLPHSVQQQPSEQTRCSVSNDFDLNCVNNASEESNPGSDGPSNLMLFRGQDSRSRQTAFFHSLVVSDIHQTSPPQISENSESGSDRSPSSSQGDGQDRTGRIVFKLFGKDPREIPQLLRSQILNWLAHSPSEMESYIRPGCIILTIYLRLSVSMWEKLDTGFKISLDKLLKGSDKGFWQRGWIFAQVGHRIAFICDGQVVFDAPSEFGNAPKLLSVTPIAITAGMKANIVVKGLNISSSTSKILCAFQGKHLEQEASTESVQEDSDSPCCGTGHFKECIQIQCRNFSWTPPTLNGRCFIEVESHDLRGSSFPVIVAEQDICAEIRTLEKYFEIPYKTSHYDTRQNSYFEVKQKIEAIEFLHELGWLFQRSCSTHEPKLHVLPVTTFSPIRFKWLLEYATEQDWCAVMKKIMNIMFSSFAKSIEAKTILDEVGILHRAVRRNCRAMIEFLLAYVPDSVTENTVTTPAKGDETFYSSDNFLFKPDMPGPAGLTPLHIAASMDSAEGVLDALTNDPCQIGAKAWINVRDQTGKTPEDYALLGGRHSYIELVHKKLEKRGTPKDVNIDIPKLLSAEQNRLKMPFSGSHSASQEGAIEKGKVQGNKADIELSPRIEQSAGHCSDLGKIKRLPSYCKLCNQQQLSKRRTSTLVYRPAMLSMVAIATVCVCVTLLLKGPPQVLFVMPPFRWEAIGFGPR
uniref:TSA: Wollemia nobilis Ref_Wollemi_Transcript_9851_4110 transcribed RNA sequence n=1 Tax=Wollemia nobilis TaxID=56998 RepID=A0A0C9RMY9_9CONI